MKKLLTILFSLLFALCAAGCNKNETVDENVVDGGTAIANPTVSYDSLDEINEKVGVNIIKPGVMGKENEKYYVIADKIAQYDFELNGYEFSIRGAYETDEDISGIYSEYNTFEPNQDFTLYVNDYYLERFFDGDRQYTIVLNDPNNMDEESFMNICMELENIMKWHLDDPLVGEYGNMTGAKANAYIERAGDTYSVAVDLYLSDNETKTWIMYDVTKEDNLLKYAGENISHYVYDENGEVVVGEETASNNLGYFTIEDDGVHWTEASEDFLEDCVFAKIVY